MINIEIKARCSDHDSIREILKSLGADFKGTDHQIDTYFKISTGRLKLREGDIENNLVYYERDNTTGPKLSNFLLYRPENPALLKEILAKSNGILAIIDKLREIYYIENVKFHLDTVKDLGKFAEIESTDSGGLIKKDKLLEQCRYFMKLFEISETNLISLSYSDMILKYQIR